ncbi:MAG: DUF3326 domain-containing protein [Phycisphaerales bacterium]|nr:MAG: DUF3326 domain-containing protein [Phycisphaerales bacterium]
MLLLEQEIDLPARKDSRRLLEHFRRGAAELLPEGLVPVRFVVTASETSGHHCEVGAISGLAEVGRSAPPSVFEFTRRTVENTSQFNVVLLVPTGIGAEIGGHAGDAAPVARVLAAGCDTLITHPNVVNASDINEIPGNGLYVEGSVICRLLMGTLGLERVRSNRVLVVIDAHEDEFFVNAAVNSVNAARASYGLRCPKIIELDPPVKLRARYASSGAAAGRIEAFDGLCAGLDEHREQYDAVALSSVIDVPHEYHMEYFRSEGKMINPWGGVEAMLTHAISSLYNVPSAHAPMLESREIANMDPGIVDPRMAAEAVSTTFLQCTLKGLQRSPRIVTGHDAIQRPNVITAEDVSCLVIPDGCLGLPTLACLEQGMPVIAVRENRNVMRNDLTALPWAPGQLHVVENYWEAAGIIAALRAGITPESVRRPFPAAIAEKKSLRPGITASRAYTMP